MIVKELWLQWLEDEQKFAESDEEHQQVEELFEKAVQDYMCEILYAFLELLCYAKDPF